MNGKVYGLRKGSRADTYGVLRYQDASGKRRDKSLGRVTEEEFVRLRRIGGEPVEFIWKEDSQIEIVRRIPQTPSENEPAEEEPVSEPVPADSPQDTGQSEPVPPGNSEPDPQDQAAVLEERFLSGHAEARAALVGLIDLKGNRRAYTEARAWLAAAVDAFNDILKY